MIARRTWIQLSGSALGFAIWPTFPNIAEAQCGEGLVALVRCSSVSQRIFLDQVGLQDAPVYVAFLETALDAPRGDAVARFQARVAELTAATPTGVTRSLEAALDRGARMDFLAQLGARDIELGELTNGVVARAGLDGLIERSIGAPDVLALVTGATQPGPHLTAAFQQLVNGVPTFRVVGQAIADIGALPGRLHAAASEGVLGLLSSAAAELSRIASGTEVGRIAGIVDGAVSVGRSAASFVGAIAAGRAPDVAALSGAVQTLGTALRLPQRTVQTITQVVNVIGSVASGAMAGSAFGPIGTVVGGLVGLLGGLFGGSSGPDPTMQALETIDRRLQAIHQEMRQSFDVMQRSLTAISQQIAQGFQAVSTQLDALAVTLRDVRHRAEQHYDGVMQSLAGIAQGAVYRDADTLVALSESYTRDLVRARLMRSAEPSTTSIDAAVAGLLSHVRHPGSGLANPAVVGTQGLAELIGAVADRAGRSSLQFALGYRATLTGIPITGSVGPPPPPSPPPGVGGGPAPLAESTSLLVSHIATELARGLTHDDHESAAVRTTLGLTTTSTCRILGDVRQVALAAFGNYASSPEAALAGPERAALASLPGVPSATCVRPSDLWGLAARLNEALAALTNPTTLETCAQRGEQVLAPLVVGHALFGDPALLHALCYVHRRLAVEFAGHAQMLVANPVMWGIQTARRALRTRLATEMSRPFGPRHSEIRLATESEARSFLASERRRVCPLADVVEGTAIGAGAIPAVVEEIVQLAYTGATSGEASMRIAARLEGSTLPDSVRAVSGVSFDVALERAVRTGFALAVVDELIAKVPSPPAPRFMSGLGEFLHLFVRCLGEPVPPGVAGQVVRTRALCFAMIGGPAELVGVPPSFASRQAKLYPVEIGHFWGWGAEALRPAAISRELGEFREQPGQCLRIANTATLEASASLRTLRRTVQAARLGDVLIERMRRATLSGGLRGVLEQQVATWDAAPTTPAAP